MILLEIVST